MGRRRLLVSPAFICLLLKAGTKAAQPRTPLPDNACIIGVSFAAKAQVITILVESDAWPADGPQAIDSAPFHDDVWTR